VWKAVHVYYYEDDKDHLLTGAIRPAIDKLRERGLRRWFLKRHWKRGPHIAMVLDANDGTFETEWLPLIEAVVRPWLNRNPSRKEINPDQYQKLSETLGAWELEPGPYLPLFPDNSLHALPYERREDVVSGARVAEALEDFRADVAGATLDLIVETQGDRGKRLERMVQLMAVIGELYPHGGILRGHLSYRSHVEGYLHTFDASGEIRRKFREQDRQLGPRIDRLLLEVLDHSGGNGIYDGPDPLLRHWSLAAHKLIRRALALAEKGELTSRTDHYKEIAAGISTEAVKRWDETASGGRLSPFHRNLQSREEGLQVLGSPHFAAYRMAVNAFYAHLPLFQINPHTKHLLCELVANSVERIKGVTWQELTGFTEGESGHA
jgi:hypothetical protein